MVDKHRMSYSGGVKAQEEQKWGRAKAEERYGPLKFRDGAPPPQDRHAPQHRENQHGPGYDNDTSGWVRAPNEDATAKPNFDSRGKDGKPDKW